MRCDRCADVFNDLAFIRHANKKALGQRRSVVGLMILSAFLLIILLALQITFDQRNHLAAKNPRLHLALTTACEYMNCTIQPDMQIDALKIDSSSFQKIQPTNDGEISELKVSIKNNATWPIAVPALELSLTEANDNIVLKRVLSVKELRLKNSTLPALSESQVTVRLLLSPSHSISSENSQITGYRILAFYP